MANISPDEGSIATTLPTLFNNNFSMYNCKSIFIVEIISFPLLTTISLLLSL